MGGLSRGFGELGENRLRESLRRGRGREAAAPTGVLGEPPGVELGVLGPGPERGLEQYSGRRIGNMVEL